jgi:hypothetical protein
MKEADSFMAAFVKSDSQQPLRPGDVTAGRLVDARGSVRLERIVLALNRLTACSTSVPGPEVAGRDSPTSSWQALQVFLGSTIQKQLPIVSHPEIQS